MDVYKLLHEDHIKVKSLFKELEDTTERAVKTREHLFANLKMELTLHAEAEERFFYPRLEPPKETHELTLEALEEHKVVKTLLAELDEDDKGTEEWAAKLTVLRENVEHHVKEEEEELFRKAKAVLSREDAESIGEEIEEYKEEYSELEERN
ncbi:MAG TPA: hemerythrin domain-containing protein [Fibrobacteria bacterium]|nr:hemerythrin domain-containing protein [Fibrobacteria bacterium]